MTLENGKTFNLASLKFTGWTVGDGTGTDGYNVADYFSADGTYLGPDEHGIEPTFASLKATYELKVKSDSDADIQPTVASLESPLVESIDGIDTDRVRVELVDGADAAAYETLMDSDPDVYRWSVVAAQ